MFHKCSDKCLCALSQPGGKETVLYCYGEVSHCQHNIKLKMYNKVQGRYLSNVVGGWYGME